MKNQRTKHILELINDRYPEHGMLLQALTDRDPVAMTALFKLDNEKSKDYIGYNDDEDLDLFEPVPEIYDAFNMLETLVTPMSSDLVYTGIGARKTPSAECAYMTKMATRLEAIGFLLRSGAANGADNAFESGVHHPDNLESYLPWKGFNHSKSERYSPSEEAFLIARILHPNGFSLNKTALALMARNGHQVLGKNLDDPVNFVVCYTPDGLESAQHRSRESGGTGQAIELADLYGIPVYNLKNDDAILRLTEHVNMIAPQLKSESKKMTP